MNMLKLTTAILMTGGLMIANTAFAADKCKHFDIKIDNETGYTAKVTKVEYYGEPLKTHHAPK